MKKKIYTRSTTSILTLIAGFSLGLLLGTHLMRPKSDTLTGVALQKFNTLIELIESDYVDTVSTQTLVESAIHHVLSQLDPHSIYLSASERKETMDELKGNFEGIGIEFNIFHDTLVVVSALSGGPSEAVGLQSGDQIILVNNKNIAGINLTNRDVHKYLKGPKGSTVTIGILRPPHKTPISYTIVRDRIPQYSVDAQYMITPEIGYIKISRFAETTHTEVRDAINNLMDKGMKKLILDLQGNPGGYMDQAIAVADEFLTRNKKIVYTKGKANRYGEEILSTSKGNYTKGPLIILVNEGSASASEIVSGALQDHKRAQIVGRRTFGKGLVQRSFELVDDSEVRLTISRYFTPNGKCIQKSYADKTLYSKELMNRYRHGELFYTDSMASVDSLTYNSISLSQPLGGVIPDHFVPLDTSQNSSYSNKLFAANVLHKFAFDYAHQHKSKMTEKGFSEYINHFHISDAMIDQVVALGKDTGISEKMEERSKPIFQIYLKAEIARQVWGNSYFFSIYNDSNEVLQYALTLMDDLPASPN